MATKTESYYVAVLEINKVTSQEDEASTNSRSYTANTEKPKKLKTRESREVLKIVVRSTSVEGLQKKLKGHIDLMDSDGGE